MSKIFKEADTKFSNGMFADTTDTKDVPDFGLTADDVAILGVVLKCAKQAQDSKRLDFMKILKDSNIVNNLTTNTPSYEELLDSFNDRSNSLGPNKIREIKKLLSLSSGRLTTATSTAKIADIKANTNELYRCAPFIQVDASELVKFAVSKDAIEVGESFAIANNNSFSNALGPVIPRTTNTYAFSLNENGLYVLKTIDNNGKVIDHNFDATYVEMTEGNDFCRTFGSSKGTADNCAKMYAECLGANMHDASKCRTHFKSLQSVSKNLKGWNSLSSEQKRYAAYRVLLGLGINGYYDENGDYSYMKNNIPYLDNSEIINTLGISSDPKSTEKVEYIKKLMDTVNVIKSQNVRPSSDRPSKPAEVRPNVAMINPTMIIPQFGQLFAGLHGLHGGARENTNIDLIQYGGGIDDAHRIINNIRSKLDLLASKGRALNAKDRHNIEDKIGKFMSLASEITNLDRVLVDFLVASSQHPEKDIVFTRKDVDKIKSDLDARRQEMSKKINKFEKLDMKLLYSLN
jgi:hypothetical protein